MQSKSEFTLTQYLVYNHLTYLHRTEGWACSFNATRVAEDMHIHRRSVYNALEQLTKMGKVERIETYSNSHRNGKTLGKRLYYHIADSRNQ